MQLPSGLEAMIKGIIGIRFRYTDKQNYIPQIIRVYVRFSGKSKLPRSHIRFALSNVRMATPFDLG